MAIDKITYVMHVIFLVVQLSSISFSKRFSLEKSCENVDVAVTLALLFKPDSCFDVPCKRTLSAKFFADMSLVL